MRLEKEAIIGILHDEPAFSEMFVAHLLVRTIRDQPADVTPQKARQRAMRVTLLVGDMMMLAMQRDPDYRRLLHAADAQNGE